MVSDKLDRFLPSTLVGDLNTNGLAFQFQFYRRDRNLESEFSDIGSNNRIVWFVETRIDD